MPGYVPSCWWVAEWRAFLKASQESESVDVAFSMNIASSFALDGLSIEPGETSTSLVVVVAIVVGIVVPRLFQSFFSEVVLIPLKE